MSTRAAEAQPVKTKRQITFELSVSGRNDGTVEAAYICLSPHSAVTKTVEVKRNELLADFDSKGNLVGVEILAPVKLRKIASLVKKPVKTPFRTFIRKSVPRELVLT